MKRRQFITLLGGAVAWPQAARAQQSERLRRIGVLNVLQEDDPEWVARRAVFEQALRALGWTAGTNLRIDYRWTGSDPGRIQRFAAELAALKPDVILASGNLVIAQILQAARTSPIVLAQVIDPVGSGFVESMARGPAATLPALLSLNTASPENGWNCSRRLRRASRGLRCFVIQRAAPESASSP
jgi:putative ABC transport system substrate-binding protein